MAITVIKRNDSKYYDTTELVSRENLSSVQPWFSMPSAMCVSGGVTADANQEMKEKIWHETLKGDKTRNEVDGVSNHVGRSLEKEFVRKSLKS